MALLTLTVTLGLVLLFVYVAACYFYNLFSHPLSSFPGPQIWAASYLPWIFAACSGRLPFILKELHDKYGPVVRVRPDSLDYDCVQAWDDIYGFVKGNKQASFKKDMLFYGQTATGAPHIIQANDEDHRRLRRLQSHAFSEKALTSQEVYLQQYVRSLMDALRKQVAGPKKGVIDMAMWYNFTTFDLIGDLAFAHPFGCTEKAELHPWIATVFHSISVMQLQHIARLYPAIERLIDVLIPKSQKEKRANHFKWSAHRVQERLDMQTERKDFMSYMMKEKGAGGMSRDEMSEAAGILIMAGSETSATLMAGLTYFLLKSPKAYRRLVDEIRSSFSASADITMVKLGQLKYLNACIDEGLRVFPPAPTSMPRVVPKGGAMICGEYVAQDTIVGVTQWAAHRSPRNFVEPDSFIPERWLGEPRFAKDIEKARQPFSYGPRNCIGRNLAYAEIRLVMANVLWSYDIELEPESSDWFAKNNVYLLWEKPPLMVRLVPRMGL